MSSKIQKGKKKVNIFRIIGSQALVSAKRLPRKKVRRAVKRPARRPPKRPPTRPARRPPKRPPTRPARRPPKRPPKSIPRIKGKGLRPGKKAKVKQGYDVFGKSRGKFIKLNRKPLSKQDAKDRGSFAIDKSTSRTLRIKPIGTVKGLGKLGRGEKGHFKKTSNKFRENIIRKKRPIKTKNKFIEKRTHAIDSRGEKKQLGLAKLVKQKGWVAPKKKRKVVKKQTIKKTKQGKRR